MVWNELKNWALSSAGVISEEEAFANINQTPQEQVVQEELQNEEREAAWRFQEQCYLMLKWEKLVKKNGDRETGRRKAYRNFCQIEHPRPFEYNNLLFKKGDNPDILFNLDSAQLSLLVPEIRIYKEFVDPNTKRSYSIELPFDDVTRRDKIDQIRLTSVGRGGGVGLKSFTWKSLGTNPANKFTFGATMVLHFQNIEELFEVRDIRNVSLGGNSQTLELRYSDLLLPQRKFREGSNEGSFTYNRDYFRVKAVCGWYVPRDTQSQLVFGPNNKKILDALSQTKTILYLGLKNHEFDFRDDGTVELTINYIAYSDSLMSDPQKSNILFPDPETSKRKERLAKDIDNLENILAKEEERLRSSGGSTPPQGQVSQEESVEITKQLLEDKKEELEKVNGVSKELSYTRIINNLLLSRRMFLEVVPTDFTNKQLRVLSQRRPSRFTAEQAEQRNEETRELNSQAKSTRRPVDGRDYAEMRDLIAEDFDGFLGEGGLSVPFFGDTGLGATTQEDRLENQIEAARDLASYDATDFNGTDQNVIYFYFGDLIEIVLDGMFSKKNAPTRSNFLQKDAKVLLGNLTFYDYGQLVDTGLVIKTKGLKNDKFNYDQVYTGKRVSVNMADIPISLKVFTNWFLENVMDKGLEHMSFKTFVDKIVNDLLIRAVSSECREFAPRQQVRMTYRSFSVPENKNRTGLFERSLSQKGGFNIPLEQLKGAEFKLSENKTGQEGEKPIENYVLIYGTVENPFDLKADVGADRAKGIYHLFFGNEYGMVKRIQFKREDLPFIREANIQNNLVDKKGPAKVLRDKYNASVEMFGNNLFDVGGKVHITPSIFGSGAILDRSKVLKDLGIGGYFDIIAVENKIESGRFETTLDTKWTARGDGTFNVGDEEFSTVNPSNSRTRLNVGSSRVL